MRALIVVGYTHHNTVITQCTKLQCVLYTIDETGSTVYDRKR